MRFSILSLLSITAVAAFILGFLSYKHREADIRRAIDRTAFYDRMVSEQANATGPALAMVVAGDSGEPVPGVVIGMTLIGTDGGDGGFQCYLTRETGIACLHQRLCPGRYQYHLVPDPRSRFIPTEWRRGQPYIIVASDGTIASPTLRLTVDVGG